MRLVRGRGPAPRRRTAFPAPAPGRLDSTLSTAVLVYLGVGISSYPTRLREATLGPEEWGDGDLAEMTSRVETAMRQAHPELSDDAVRALAWNFSYQNR